MLTLFHPNDFLGCSASELSALPWIGRDRTVLELRREAHAASRGRVLTYEHSHGRKTSNLGKSGYDLRRNWISGALIAGVVNEYDVRLIRTEETGSQARWRCEFRHDWADTAAAWPATLKRRMIRGLASAPRLSIRQLWRNPTAARFGSLPLAVPPETADELGNLIVGPFEAESRVKAPIDIQKIDDAWWITKVL